MLFCFFLKRRRIWFVTHPVIFYNFLIINKSMCFKIYVVCISGINIFCIKCKTNLSHRELDPKFSGMAVVKVGRPQS